MALIELIGVTHRFSNGTRALDSIDLAVVQGGLVLLTGPNGSGKTTLLQTLNGLLLPEKGEVRIDGKPVSENLSLARRRVGLVFQDADSQIVGETVRDDVAFGPENLKLAREQVDRRTRQALEEVGLSSMADHRPHTLSGGEKRRLAIAGVLAMAPSIVALDEPFNSLDFPSVRQVLATIVRLHQSGRTVLVTTHDVEKISAHADRLIVMSHGRIVEDGRPAEIMHRLEEWGVRRPCATRLGHEVESWLN